MHHSSILQNGKFNIVVDGQFGSCGKGLICSYIARHDKIQHVSSTNMANAGHTAVNENGEVHIAKALPVSAILPKWYDDSQQQVIRCWLGASSGFTIDRMNEEFQLVARGVNSTRNSARQVIVNIHDRAGVITDEHAKIEAGDASTVGATEHIASTMQGCGAMLAAKVMRRNFSTAGQFFSELERGTTNLCCIVKHSAAFTKELHAALDSEHAILHEGAQGFALDINHGHSYPTCTSRQCTPMQMAADMGVPHQKIGEVIMVIRPYPIRVGNVMRNGRMTGHSGDWYPDQSELTWEEIGVEPEITTVTGRKRRVASFSEELLRQSIQIMNPTQIALNFANYLDPSFSEVGGYMNLDMLRKKWPTIFNFVATVEKQTDTPITLLGSGPQINHVVRITR